MLAFEAGLAIAGAVVVQESAPHDSTRPTGRAATPHHCGWSAPAVSRIEWQLRRRLTRLGRWSCGWGWAVGWLRCDGGGWWILQRFGMTAGEGG
jgi:hypothetical protein